MGYLNKLQQDFYSKYKLTLQDAIERINIKTGEAIDYAFMCSVGDVEEYKDIILEQVKEIEDTFIKISCVKDNLLERYVTQTILDIDKSKRESDDTRIARKIIDKERLITSILSSPYRFNPLLELNEILYPQKTYPVIWKLKPIFHESNKDFVEKIYYPNSHNIKNIKIKRGFEKNILLTRDMIIDIDLRLYPFYLRREIENANYSKLKV